MDAVRFWSKVDKSDYCWTWNRATNSGGYGKFGVTRRVWKLAHRVSWEMAYGPIPDEGCVLHSCDNPPCVRPDHLFLGSKTDNAADRGAKGRTRNQGKKLTANQVREIRQAIHQGAVQARLAEKYRVSSQTITNVKYGVGYSIDDPDEEVEELAF